MRESYPIPPIEYFKQLDNEVNTAHDLGINYFRKFLSWAGFSYQEFTAFNRNKEFEHYGKKRNNGARRTNKNG